MGTKTVMNENDNHIFTHELYNYEEEDNYVQVDELEQRGRIEYQCLT